MPNSAPKPVPTITAVGVAKPIAHGQAITRTATEFIKAVVKSDTFINSPEIIGIPKYHIMKVANAIIRTAGTKTADTLSVVF